MFNKKSVSVAAAVVLFGSLALGFVGLGSRAKADWREPRGLAGTWRLQLTPVYCSGVTTGKLAAPFQGLVSFTGDGTLINTLANSLFGYDTPGHGFWWRTDDHTYQDVFEVLIVDPPSPYVPGTQKGFATITLGDENDFTAQVTAEYFDSSDTIYSTKCIDVVGTRLNDSQTEP